MALPLGSSTESFMFMKMQNSCDCDEGGVWREGYVTGERDGEREREGARGEGEREKKEREH